MGKTLCLDCDGTLWTTAWPLIGVQKPVHNLILKFAKHLQRKGWFVTSNTCREEEYLVNALSWLAVQGFVPDGANTNNPKNIEAFGDCRKVSGDLMIDDKNIGILGAYLRFVDRRWGRHNGIS